MPRATLATYVDKREELTENPEKMAASFESLRYFTGFWDLQPTIVKALRAKAFSVSFQGRDLGAYMGYSKKGTNAILTFRLPLSVADQAPVIFRASSAKSIGGGSTSCAIWGANVHAGPAHFGRLRAGAMRGCFGPPRCQSSFPCALGRN